MADKPIFIDSDPQATLDALIADYEARTGRTLQPAQAERLVINSVAYILSLYKEQANEAALQNLVQFADSPALDRLGDLVGVVRLEAQKATTTIQFTLVDGHGGVTIPAGTRVASIDQTLIFQTSTAVDVAAGTNIAEASAEAADTGSEYNGLPPAGLVNVLDPQPFLSSAENITTTAGGTDKETDDALRERIKLAPSQFSTAGSRESYIFHAKTASGTIVDVGITQPVPGVVNVYPMVAGGGTTPTETLEAVEAAVTSERVRPLTDSVTVLSPSTTFYTIEVDLTLFTNAVQAQAVADVEASLEAYHLGKSSGLGNDIVISQIIRAVNELTDVYDVSVTSPGADIVVDETTVAVCTGVTVNVIGTNEG